MVALRGLWRSKQPRATIQKWRPTGGSCSRTVAVC